MPALARAGGGDADDGAAERGALRADGELRLGTGLFAVLGASAALGDHLVSAPGRLASSCATDPTLGASDPTRAAPAGGRAR